MLVASMAFTKVVALKSARSSCECMNWKDTYDSGAVQCGDGKEVFEVNPSKTPQKYRVDTPMGKKKWCQIFFTKLDFNQCVNIGPGADGSDEGTWCYVSKECDTLRGGHKLANVSWKLCRRSDPSSSQTKVHGDARLRDRTPEELSQLSQKYDLPLSYVTKMAYPGSRAGQPNSARLSEFTDQNGLPTVPTHLGQHRSQREELNWVDTNDDGTLPTMIFSGKKLYKVDKKSDRQELHPGTWAGLECLKGCDENAVVTIGRQGHHMSM